MAHYDTDPNISDRRGKKALTALSANALMAATAIEQKAELKTLKTKHYKTELQRGVANLIKTLCCPINPVHCILVFSDRMNRIYMIFIYPDYPIDPVKKWKFLYY